MKKYVEFLKCFCVYFGYQCLLYFGSKLFQGNPHLVHSVIDDKIPYFSWMVIFYVMWFGFLLLIPFLLYKKDKVKLNRLFISFIIAITVCNIFFVIYPSTVIRAADPGNGIFGFIVKVIYFFDNPPINCFPSMHCLFAYLFIFSTFNNKNINKGTQIFILLANIGVCASTLCIKQHAFADMLLAFPIAMIIWICTKYININYIEFINKKRK